ncbi:MAG: hypothetical protein IKH93_06360, partial [Bacteroidales bacterium]|nr:hypothetical protein [Bacteroidales bacterium]
MLTLKLLREQPDFVVERLAVKHFDAREIVDKILEADRSRRALQTELDACLASQKTLAAQIGSFMKSGDKESAEKVKAEVAQLKERSKALEADMDSCSKQQNDLLPERERRAVWLAEQPHKPLAV